ncbi:MAG: S1C family serine protease [Ornithinimicrobium sp.]|uniref:S1C family serine protease n=1 Tax=Ornithinimicrobium sp. TaxID=1977084 RepID=UPI003D9B2B41
MPHEEPTRGIPVERTAPLTREPSGWDSSTWDPATPEATVRDSAAWNPPPTGPYAPPQTHRPRVSRAPAVVLVALLAGLGGGLAGGYAVEQLSRSSGQPVVTEAFPVAASGSDGAPVARIARMTLPSVVFISVEGGDGDGVGSGFVIRPDGYLVTNNHVIAAGADGGDITVEFTDGDSAPAEVVGTDPSYDLAVLKVDRAGLPVLQFGDSETLQVGVPVVAVGAPLGLDNTVTSGIVSALDRPVVAGDVATTTYINAIQTDAAINPGNSGGPLLDLSGRVVGVNSAIAQLPGGGSLGPAGSIGLGFAIPAAQAQRTTDQLIETGTSEHPVMGIHVDVEYSGEGARVLPEATGDVEPVIPGGPAEAAGVQPGDVILKIDDEPIEDSSKLIVQLRSHRVGDTVQVLLRSSDGTERTVSITLQGSSE